MTAAMTWDELAAGLAREPVVPSAPKPATEVLPLWRTILQLRRNALTTWGEPAYEHDIFSRPFMGRTSFLVSHPDAIRRVLVDNHANYGRTPATIRILQPILGDGLFLAEGNAWKHQRRTMAPAFAPRSLDVAACHMAQVADETVAELARRGTSAVDLLRVVQYLALEVAGRSFFSQGMKEHGPGPTRRLRALRQPAGAPILPRFPAAGRGAQPAGRRPLVAGARLQARARPDDRRARPHPARGSAARPVRRAGGRPRPRDRGRLHARPSCATRSRPWPSPATRPRRSTMFWASYLLGLAPEVQEQVALEARGVDLSPASAADAVEQLPLTRAVVQEALRLYPPAFTIVRRGQGPGRTARRARAGGQHGGDGTLDPAPPPQALGTSGALRPDPLPSRRTLRSTASPTCRSASARASASAPSSR